MCTAGGCPCSSSPDLQPHLACGIRAGGPTVPQSMRLVLGICPKVTQENEQHKFALWDPAYLFENVQGSAKWEVFEICDRKTLVSAWLVLYPRPLQ